MANPYYTQSGNPGTGAAGSSAPMRSEFAAVQAAFDKMPTLAGNANAFVVVNPGATGLTVVAGLTFTMNTFTVAATATASVAFNWPASNGTLALTTDVTTQAAATLLLAAPPGTMHVYAAATAPSGYLLCAGQAVSRIGANAALFAAISTTFGVGDGSTTFNLPDMRGRVPAGLDNPGGLGTASRITNAGSGIVGTTLGAAGSAQNNVTTMSSSGSTSGSLGVHISTGNASGPNDFSGTDTAGGRWMASSAILVSVSGDGSTSGGLGVNVAGTSATFSITQPTIILNYIIKL